MEENYRENGYEISTRMIRNKKQVFRVEQFTAMLRKGQLVTGERKNREMEGVFRKTAK